MKLIVKVLVVLNKVVSKFTSYRMVKSPSKSELKEVLTMLQPRQLPANISLIRVGHKSDGGYALPNCLTNISACISPGVGPSVSFEMDLFEKYGIKSHLLDSTVNKINSNFVLSYTEKLLSHITNEKYISFNDWCAGLEISTNNRYILQMDIEGAEYESILSVSDKYMDAFDVVVLELHSIDHIASKVFFNIFKMFLTKLLKFHHVVHIHPNTNSKTDFVNGVEVDRTIEVTLLHKNFFKNNPSYQKHYIYPVSGVDFSNIDNVPDRQLASSYFNQEK